MIRRPKFCPPSDRRARLEATLERRRRRRRNVTNYIRRPGELSARAAGRTLPIIRSGPRLASLGRLSLDEIKHWPGD